jgi:hypothetical protein
VATTDPTGSATWQDPAWRDAAIAWATDRLGAPLTGAPRQEHVRPWSTAIRLPVDGGAVWLKSVGPGAAHESALAAALGEWAPEQVLVPLAVDRERRLLLLPDGGPTLREVGGAAFPEAWEAMLRSYARLQIALVPHVAEMLAFGVPDARPERLPGLVADLLADDDAQLIGHPDGLAPAVRDRIAADLDRYAFWCRELAGSGVPATLQHDDLHDANVFVAANRYRFFDWGDASVSHPFLSLLVTLRAAARALDVGDDHPVLFRLRDVYLAEWRDYGTLDELAEQCTLALRVGPLQRALTWYRVLLGVEPAERAEWQNAVPGWTAEHLEPGSLGIGV